MRVTYTHDNLKLSERMFRSHSKKLSLKCCLLFILCLTLYLHYFHGNRLLKCALCIAASPRARKPVGGEIARCAIESSAASFGLRLSSRREAASDSPYRVSPPHRTRNGSAVTKGHEKFEPFNNDHKGQLLNYLRITGMKLGLLVNFRSYPKVEILRLAN